MEYKEQNDGVKQIIIDLATEAQYGNPEYTNMNEIDYKFWEDCEHKDSVIILAQMLDKERTDQKVREHIDSALPDKDYLKLKYVKEHNNYPFKIGEIVSGNLYELNPSWYRIGGQLYRTSCFKIES